MVLHCITALEGPLLELERRLIDANAEIERWFRLQWQDHVPPFYGSVDLRNAGFKLAPVDTNLYPGAVSYTHLTLPTKIEKCRSWLLVTL